jgi:hypothetical protein
MGLLRLVFLVELCASEAEGMRIRRRSGVFAGSLEGRGNERTSDGTGDEAARGCQRVL